jgi:hypothetical protein
VTEIFSSTSKCSEILSTFGFFDKLIEIYDLNMTLQLFLKMFAFFITQNVKQSFDFLRLSFSENFFLLERHL